MGLGLLFDVVNHYLLLGSPVPLMPLEVIIIVDLCEMQSANWLVLLRLGNTYNTILLLTYRLCSFHGVVDIKYGSALHIPRTAHIRHSIVCVSGPLLYNYLFFLTQHP